MSVEDLLDWIDRRLVGGTLTVESASVIRSFVFDSGYLVSVMSNVTSEQGGQLLLRAGLADEETLGHALAAQADNGTPLTASLQEMGGIDEGQLRDLLSEHAVELLLDTMMWETGDFAFEMSDEVEIVIEFPISVRLRSCVVKSRQRAPRWREIRQHIPRDDVGLRVADRKQLGGDDDGEEALAQILELTQQIENGWSIEQMVGQYNGWRFTVMDQLATLITRGGIAVTEEASSPPSPGPNSANLERAARVLADAGDLEQALELVRQAAQLEPGNENVRKLQNDVERRMFAELSREFLTSFRIPKLLVERAELDLLDLSETERYLAGRVDGRWDLLSLMRVAPVREVEALITFKRLADRGIISL